MLKCGKIIGSIYISLLVITLAFSKKILNKFYTLQKVHACWNITCWVTEVAISLLLYWAFRDNM